MLDAQNQIIFRMDVGENAHKIVSYGYNEPVSHINIEIQVKNSAGKWKPKWDYHIILDEFGEIDKTFITGVWKNR